MTDLLGSSEDVVVCTVEVQVYVSASIKVRSETIAHVLKRRRRNRVDGRGRTSGKGSEDKRAVQVTRCRQAAYP
jgi:hypothetical protein